MIKKELDKYLEFDSDLLFDRSFVDYACVFGGAIRDIVAGDGDKIHDVDILGMSMSISHIFSTLENNGYEKVDLVKPNINELYKDIKFIFDPITLMNKNRKIVQLIRPSQRNLNDNSLGTFSGMRNAYIRLLENVDLSSSGLFYDGEDIYECVPDAYHHCKAKVFHQQTHAMMYCPQRTFNRREKLVLQNNWFEIYFDKNTGELTSSYILATRRIKMQLLRGKGIQSIKDYLLKMDSRKPIG